MGAMLLSAGDLIKKSEALFAGAEFPRPRFDVLQSSRSQTLQDGNAKRTFAEPNMLPGQASQTLSVASIMRARHQLFDAPLIFDDPVVLKLVPEAEDPDVLKDLGDSTGPMARSLRSMLAVRSRFAEDRLAEAVTRGIRQYVIFGAGLDTFPWRQPNFAKNLQIFAADHPASLVQTNRIFRERGFIRPPNLVRVPLDFEQRHIGEQLAACDFDRNAASFCSALGVLLYLEDEIVDDVLRFITSLQPSSEIVFSFFPPDDELDGLDLEIARRIGAKFAAIGEPWKSRVGPRAMVKRLSALGFGEILHLSPELAQVQYFSARSDKLAAPYFEQMIAAVVSG
jgi:methyltransferase (TIGR00027 family)